MGPNDLGGPRLGGPIGTYGDLGGQERPDGSQSMGSLNDYFALFWFPLWVLGFPGALGRSWGSVAIVLFLSCCLEQS